MDLPRVLIVSTVGVERAKNIAREMGSEHLADGENVNYHVWTIDNKYYSAKVLLCIANATTIDISPCSIEAMIIHHDPKAAKDTKCLDDCLTIVNSLPEAEIFLLVCQSFGDSETREKVTEWSQIHKFELVEMERPNPSDIMDEGTEDNIYGIERIIEALHTNLWPNRILKAEMPNSRVETSEDVNIVEDQLESMRLNTGTRENSDQLLMESVLDGIMGEENTDFGELFGRLMDMKEHTSSLSSNNRREAAEQLVTAFWKAMGGDPSEVEDLDQ